MFRRRDEDEVEFTLQPTNKSFSGGPSAPSQAAGQSYNPNPGQNPTSSGSSSANAYATQTPGQNTMQNFSQYSAPSDQAAAQTPSQSAPYVRTNGAYQDNAKTETAKESKPAKSAAAVNNFVPSALRASSSAAASPSAATASTAGQNVSFPSKSAIKIDNIGLETERRLTVGYGISLEGKVSDCDKLVIYGNVNAELNNVKALQISDSGRFSGAAEIDYAEISGTFQGELKVRKTIVINNTGRVSGKITYGSIEIKPGGKFTGEIVEDKILAESSQNISDESPSMTENRDDLSLFSESKTENKAA